MGEGGEKEEEGSRGEERKSHHDYSFVCNIVNYSHDLMFNAARYARTAPAHRTYIYTHDDSVPISFRREIEIQHAGKRGKLVIYSSGRAVTALKLSVGMVRYIVDRLACRECTNVRVRAHYVESYRSFSLVAET